MASSPCPTNTSLAATKLQSAEPQSSPTPTIHVALCQNSLHTRAPPPLDISVSTALACIFSKLTNMLDNSLYDILEDQITTSTIRTLQAEGHKIADLTMDQCHLELFEAVWRLDEVTSEVCREIDRLARDTLAAAAAAAQRHERKKEERKPEIEKLIEVDRPRISPGRTVSANNAKEGNRTDKKMMLRKYQEQFPEQVPIDLAWEKPRIVTNHSPRLRRRVESVTGDSTGRKTSKTQVRVLRRSSRVWSRWNMAEDVV